MPTFGSLFAGIGGIDLGLERAGWRGRWQVEYEPFCQRVLAKHWPDVTRYGDIHDVEWESVERVDLVAGGFPCQPVSYAGRGLAQDDVRWLWPEFLRCVRALRPRYVLVENVPGLLTRGLGDVLGGLAEIGYDAEWDCIPASAVGALHQRDRLWIVAYTDGLGQGWSSPLGSSSFSGLRQSEAGSEPHGPGDGALANADLAGPQGRPVQPERPDQQPARACSVADTGRIRREMAIQHGGRRTASSGQRQADVVGSGSTLDTAREWWSVEPDVGRVAHGVPARVDRLRSLGNAVVPQVVEFIGRRILEAERMSL